MQMPIRIPFFSKRKRINALAERSATRTISRLAKETPFSTEAEMKSEFGFVKRLARAKITRLAKAIKKKSTRPKRNNYYKPPYRKDRKD